MKIFCIGYPKTGTTSLMSACSLLGFKQGKYWSEFIDWYHIGRNVPDVLSDASFLKYVESYEAFADWPFHCIYRELYELYPQARFILTTRGSKSWKLSEQHHHLKPINANRKKWGILYPGTWWSLNQRKWNHLRKTYQAPELHSSEVQSFFNSVNGGLLVMDLDRGPMQWEPLCEFLGCLVPDQPFPWKKS